MTPLQLSDHIRTLLRDHDCVIIPDFGGLIADYAPAQVHPVRHTLAPPAKRVAFNQSLTRNDGLLVDAMVRALNVPAAQARQLIRDAVAALQAELTATQRTELPGIGVFRRAVGRGLEFEYTGTQNLLPASYGLPELVSRPVRATDALLARDRKPATPMMAAARSRRTMRAFKIAAGIVIAGLVLTANYMFAWQTDYLPNDWKLSVLQPHAQSVATPAEKVARQQATLANNGWSEEFVPDGAADSKEAAPVAPEVKVAKTPTVAARPVKPAAPAKGTASVAKTAAAPKAVAPAAALAKPTVAPAALAAEPTIKARTGRYYVIAGVYTSLKHALVGRKALVDHGHRDARVILPGPGSRQYRLSAVDFPDRTTAYNQVNKLRPHLGKDLWVLNY
ncbi:MULTISPECIES: HU domain-containing protein [Hymenobacter]|uniref:SPOR domain-containing protein n=1 Tax=Hymenobacter jejuensis TaxID=2502781 RepID=A0A5B8A3V0_9BACT|nr:MULTISPECIES: hypothetical protein [Hymenobacter]MBC6989986.1 hypothetical protein [Hymenobacter sp. BT491]QDA62020.1 hypothetical protein FHG12_18775 [Hymenobacter jejuensis]